ncbi:o-succinylbenzoate--CoA ligase [Cellulomonas fengjieae]|uniref:O-succinylbenzoate--CoA ligase n=1 Tax=Cellulomonas fengjieae TaxID=2819978 RepID=A0ABS3SDT8_9CELL|nr:o-succinylbenzoate--CoA ligase [Cellulomonas fengjieae]MBO3083479.1 o-succinylbenzoate--CoA ligase [Cellulomonas fengjieae]QVI65194.1 o-succinylbenzoate--CoA ligase [Cellulomonas fengjieae]
MSRPLRDLPARPDLLLAALSAALSGRGPAVAPGAHGPVSAQVGDDVAVAVRTSGSTGEPRTVLLSASALVASGRATHARLAGPGRWLLALPTEHVAGLQVLVRSVLAGTSPVTLPTGPFRAAGFVAASASLPADGPRYTSLVPTQLVRLLADEAATAALGGFDAVLLGGAAAPPDLLARAHSAGVAVVTTYGMSETCGGCVYDGTPLDGVTVRIDDDGRILLAGPVLADGYLDRPDLDSQAFVQVDGVRHLRTTDLGAWSAGTLTVLGRADDVVVTGGAKVPPGPVEAVLAGLPGIDEVCVVGVPDPEWGQAVVAVVVPAAGVRPPSLGEVRAAVTDRIGPMHAPRHLVVADSLPVRGPGKIDRRAAAQLAVHQLERNLT